MSRIDEALRIAESASGAVVSEPKASQSGASSPLSQYRHEELNGRAIDRGNEEEAPVPAVKAQPFRPASTSRSAATQGAKLPDDADLRARLVTGTSSTVSLEQYRKLAATLHEEQVESQLKSVMITSAVPHEGKTLTVANLALTLSESYARRVLVIDADLRWPSLHTVLGVPNERGLSEALRDDGRDLPIVEVSSGLSVLTAGKPGPTPLAGLTSPRMGEVLAECAERFDWVLVDTSPIGVLPDAQVLARLVGGVILVIGAGSTPAAAVERAVAELGGPDAILGTILNRVDERRIPESGYYGQYGTSSGQS